MSTVSSSKNLTIENQNTQNSSTRNITTHDQSTIQIATEKLNGSNYLEWSQYVMIFLKGKGNMGYLDGSLVVPEKADPKFKKWEEENFMIMSWLLNSMKTEIAKTCLFLKSAKAIWDKVQGTYSKVRNTARIFELKRKIGRTSQGDRSVTAYCNQLETLWQELDHNQHLQLAYSEDSVRDRIFEFLNGLNQEYEQLRSLVLNTETLPSLVEAFSTIRDEGRKEVMMGSNSSESSALKIEADPITGAVAAANNRRGGPNKKDTLWCDFCNKAQHTRETYWKIHGKPDRFGKNNNRPTEKNSCANNAEHVAAASGSIFCKAQIEELRRVLFPNSTEPTNFVAMMGKLFGIHNISFKNEPDPWIIDSGASDHMTGNPSLFAYIPCSGHKKVRIADGSYAAIYGKGTIRISETLNTLFTTSCSQVIC